MKLLEGVSLSELILMGLGLVLGIVLLSVFVYTAIKKEPNLNLIYAFLIPVIMIGYPSIQKVQFDKGVVTIDKYAAEVEKNPLDTTAHKQLNQAIEAIPAGVAKESSSAMTAIAKGQAALGQYETARVTANKAWELDSTSPKVVEVRNMIRSRQIEKRRFDDDVNKLGDKVSRWEHNHNDSKDRDSIGQVLHSIDAPKNGESPLHVDPKSLLTVAKAAAIDGHSQDALKMLDDILKINPDSQEAIELKRRIENKEFERKSVIVAVSTPVKRTPKPNAPPNIRSSSQMPVHPSDTVGLKLRLVPRAIFQNNFN